MNKQQLASKIWAAANKLRGKIDANEYKDYILGLIFYKFLSDTEVKFLKENMDIEDEDLKDLTEDFSNPDMATLIEECQQGIGFYIQYKYLFGTWLKKDSEFNVAVLSEALNSFDRLMSDNYKSVYKGIFDTLRAGLSKLGENAAAQTKALKEIISLIRDIPTNGSEDYDVLGYVYEYLIGNFAANAGKKAGEFYTPHEVAMVMSEIVADHHKDKENITIYDPTSGSGSLLITIGKAVSKHLEGRNNVKYYAQELMENTYNLTRMNLVMRGIIPQNIITRNADSLAEDWPIHEEGVDIDKPLAVDAVVSNPPYSWHWDINDMEYDPRFREYGVAPKTKADYAFLLHELHHLKAEGIMTIIMPHGVLFRGKSPKILDEEGNMLEPELREEGQGEGIIRANLIEKNNIDAIIGLPAGIFFGTPISTIIMILKKNRGDEGVLIIDASKGFVKDGKQNRLRACDIKKITDTYKGRMSIPGYSREVSRNEIRRNEYNLNIPRYVDSSDKPEQYDIYATMFGGIPENEIKELSEYWEVFPSLKSELVVRYSDKPYYQIAVSNPMETISENKDVKEYKKRFGDAFLSFREMMKIRLIDHVEDVKESVEIENISEDIMKRCQNLPLVDSYSVYQILSEHWGDIMGDIEIIQTEGYGACNEIETKYKIKKKNDKEEEVPDGLKGRIMPFDLVQRTYLSDHLDALNNLRNRLERNEGEQIELLEGLDAEEQEALLNDDNTKFDSKGITKAFNEICSNLEIGKGLKKVTKAKKEELFLAMHLEPDSYEWKIQRIMALQSEESKLKEEIKKSEAQLEEETIAKIKGQDMKETIELLRLKWIEPVASRIDAIPEEIVAKLTDEVTSLASKYAVSMTDIDKEIHSSEAELANLIENLTGDEYSIKGLQELIKS